MQLPNSKSSEEALMGAILIDDSILNLTELTKEDFYDINLWKIFNLCKVLKSNRKSIDIVVLQWCLEAKGVLESIWWLSYLVELTESATSVNWKDYEDIIKDKSQRREILRYAMRMEQTARDEGRDARTALEWIENITNILFKEKNWNWIEDLVEDFENIRELYNKQGALWYKWPFENLDKYTQGIIPWMVYMICAYSNVWKSAFSYAYACDLLKKGKKVLFFSLEVTRGVLMTNMIRCYYNKDYSQIMNPEFYFEMEDFENFKVYDNKTKLEDIKNITRAERPDAVFIDFVQNIEWLWMSEYENMTRCWKEIQALAMETDATIFNISQVGNESRYKADSMQPKGSGQLFFSSDVIIGLYKDNDMYAHIIKNKFWPNDKKFLVSPDFAKLQFKVVEDFNNDNNSVKL